MRLFDEKRGQFLDPKGVFWRFYDVINGKYDYITICKPTGFNAIEWNDILKEYDTVELYEYDYVLVDLKSGKQERDIEGIIQWRKEIATFVLFRIDTEKTVGLNGLYKIRKVGNILENDDERKDKIDSERMRSGQND